MMSNFQRLEQLVKNKYTVAVLDDFFPNLSSGFRVAEYNWYLECFPGLVIYSTNPNFYSVHAEYAQLFPHYADRIKPYDEESLQNCSFAFINFLNNAYYFLPGLSAHCIPFLMTLYPGGGFGLAEPESDAKLEQVLGSPLLRGIIATQSVTLEYLKAKDCKVPVHYIYGGTMNPIYFEDITTKISLSNSGGRNICFVAARYMPLGANKGYPQFIEAAKLLIREFPDLQFSVVGDFDKEDGLLDEDLGLAISFKGMLTTVELKDFFLTQDIIVSPNRPFLLHPGNFDGFPTGCCVEASLCGVAMVCSDELKLNHHYSNGEDIVITSPTTEAVAEAVGVLIREPSLLKKIREGGRRVSRKIFNPKIQLGKRSALLAEALKPSEAEWPNKLLERFRLVEQVLAYQANHISVNRDKLAAQEQKIAGLEKIIIDQITHIRNVEADWAARGQHIENLEVDRVARKQHIENIEVELVKLQMSWYGKSKAVGRKLKQLLRMD